MTEREIERGVLIDFAASMAITCLGVFLLALWGLG